MVIKAVGSMTATKLKDFVYEIVPEITGMKWGEENLRRFSVIAPGVRRPVSNFWLVAAKISSRIVSRRARLTPP
jgi:hypothetical protein